MSSIYGQIFEKKIIKKAVVRLIKNGVLVWKQIYLIHDFGQDTAIVTYITPLSYVIISSVAAAKIKKCLLNVSTEIHVPLYDLQDDIVDRMINDWNALFFHLPFKFAYSFTHVGRRQIYYLTVHITTDYLQVNTKHLNNVGLRMDQHQKRYPAIN